jgi:hypothetical protein
VKRALATLALVMLAAVARAGELKPFVAGSVAQIRAAHAGRPFVLALWSLDCVHCGEELPRLAELTRRHPGLDLVLISTDTPAEAAALSATLARHSLAHAEAWVFADPFTEALRYELDPHWGGELPRSYFFDRRHVPEAHSGVLSAAQLERAITRIAAPPGRD